MIYLGYVAIGLVVGSVSGLLGLGGAVLMIPALVYIMKFPQHLAQGTSIAMLLPPIGIFAAWRYWQSGNVLIVPAMILAASFAIGAFFGSSFAVHVPQLLLRKIFGCLLIGIGIFMLSGKLK